MERNEQLLREMEDLRKRLKETEEALHDLEYRQETLRDSEQEKLSILNSLQEAISFLDKEMRVIWSNKSAIECAGLPLEQITGHYCYKIWCHSDEPRADCPALKTIRMGQQGEGEIVTPDGRVWFHRGYPVRDVQGNITGIILTTFEITDRKGMEEALRKSEKDYRTLAANLPGIVYRVFIRENNRMQFYNDMLQSMMGYATEELSAGKVCSIDSFILEEDRAAVVASVKRAVLENQPFEVEYRLRKKNGEARHFFERGRPIYGEDVNPLYIDGVILDITERKTAEEELKKANLEKALILNATVEAMGLLDKNLKLVWSNRICADRAGLPPEETAGRYCYEIWAQQTEPCVGCPTLKTIETGRPEEAEISSSDGKIWLHRSYPIQDRSGHVESIVATAIDITEHKQNEEGLRKHAQILDQIHDSVISTDLDGYVATWNKGAERIFGYSAAEGLGKHISFVYPPDQHEFLQYEVIEPLKRKGRHEIEAKMRRKSGEDFYAHLSLSMLRNKKGLEIGMIGSAVDLTERRKIEEELRKSRDELEIRVRERTAKLSEANQDLQKTTEVLEKLFSGIHFMLAYIDTDFNLLRVNRAFAEDDGRDPEFFVGKNLFDLFPNADRKNFMKVVETGESLSGYEKPFVHPEHPERGVTYWDWHLQPVKEIDGKVAGIVLSFVNVTERKHAQEALLESEKRLRFLSSQLISAQEQERKRIAGELHDGLGAALSGIKYKVETALQQRGKNRLKAVEKQLESVIPMIQESVEEVRRIQTDLRPATLDRLGVLAAIRGDCRRFQTTYPSVSIQQGLEVQEDEIPARLKIVIYRILQEALNNIAKHSKADLVHLSLRKRDGKIELVVQDNGWGFDVNEALSAQSSRRGLGLTSMRERAELSGGIFVIESAGGNGTSIMASWPLRSPEGLPHSR
jgi:PAS domain S-box-containing protein